MTDAVVTCNFPSVDGLRISIFAHAPDSTHSFRMLVSATTVFIQVDVGAASTFRERNFEGRGVSRFDVARGASLDARLAEAVPTEGVPTGAIGAITSVTGSISCGDQTTGSSSLAITGVTSTGRYDASRLDPVLVECYFADGQVTAIGIGRAGTTKVLLMISLGPNGELFVEEAPKSAPPRYYLSRGGTPATLTANGGTASGDAVEQRTPSPHRLHIDGSVRCGTPIRR